MTKAKRAELDRLMKETLDKTGVSALKEKQSQAGKRASARERDKVRKGHIPDLSVSQREGVAPLSNAIHPLKGRPIPETLPIEGAKTFTIAACHKQGYEVVTNPKYIADMNGAKK